MGQKSDSGAVRKLGTDLELHLGTANKFHAGNITELVIGVRISDACREAGRVMWLESDKESFRSSQGALFPAES